MALFASPPTLKGVIICQNGQRIDTPLKVDGRYAHANKLDPPQSFFLSPDVIAEKHRPFNVSLLVIGIGLVVVGVFFFFYVDMMMPGSIYGKIKGWSLLVAPLVIAYFAHRSKAGIDSVVYCRDGDVQPIATTLELEDGQMVWDDDALKQKIKLAHFQSTSDAVKRSRSNKELQSGLPDTLKWILLAEVALIVVLVVVNLMRSM